MFYGRNQKFYWNLSALYFENSNSLSIYNLKVEVFFQNVLHTEDVFFPHNNNAAISFLMIIQIVFFVMKVHNCVFKNNEGILF